MNVLKKRFGVTASVIVAVCVTLGSTLGVGGAATALPAMSSGAASPLSVSERVAPDEVLSTRLAQLSDGESFVWRTAEGTNVTIASRDGVIEVSGTASRHARSAGEVCALAYTVATGAFVLGAAALAAIAVASGGSGAVVAGVFMTTAQLWSAAGLAGAFGGVLAWAQTVFC